MAESGVIFDRKTAERVGRATKWVENQPVDLTGTRVPFRPRIQPFVTFRVKLVKISGSNGTSSTTPSYRYDAYWPWDTTNTTKLNVANSAATLVPESGRVFGAFTEATIGLAYYDQLGALVLYSAWEYQAGVEGCA
jgi:hypothetical protein